jgi:multiple sugar transport system substrate-binding protein
MTGNRSGRSLRRAAALAVTAGCLLSAAACGGSSSGGDHASGGKTTITVGCEPPTTQAAPRKNWIADAKAFMKANPGIVVKGDDANPCDDPATFNAKLASGKMDDVFYTYFTDAANVIASGQAADIQKYASQIHGLKNIQSSLLGIYSKGSTAGGDLYGIPKGNYSLGLVYNRSLFKKAGLDPDKPPTTWDAVEQDAIAITKLGHGSVGYADYSAANTGGWHFAAELYSRGGKMVTPDGKKAAFDDAAGKETLEFLHKLRFTDNVMGTKQGLQYNDLLQMMASGKLGMYVGDPVTLTTIHDQYKVPYAQMSVGPMPGEKATLAGGDGYMFNRHDTPAQIEAGIKFVNYEYLTSGKGQFDYARKAAEKEPVGLPEPDLWTGAAAADDAKRVKKYANIPTSDFDAYTAALPKMQMIVEPPQAQAIYAQGDKAMDAVLTNPHADIPSLLGTFSKSTDSILANAQH